MNVIAIALLSLLAPAVPLDDGPGACALISGNEVAAARDDRITRQQQTSTTRGPFVVSRCFYQAADFHNSVGLELVAGSRETTRALWTQRFLEFEADGIERTAPQRVTGLGDDAWWTDNGRFASLYVLLGDRYLAVDLGGGNQENRLEVARRLAISALRQVEGSEATSI